MYYNTGMFDRLNQKSNPAPFDYSLRSRLLLLLVVMLLPLIVFSLYQSYRSYDRRSQEIVAANAQDAKEVVKNVDELVSSTSDLLIAFATSEAAKDQDYPELKRWFKEVARKHSHYKNIIFVDPDGNIRAAAYTYAKSDGEVIASVKKTAYFKRSLHANGLAYGDFMRGILSNEPVIHITYPVFSSRNERIGFVAVAFDLSRLQNRIVTSGVTRGSEISVFDQNGTVIARTLDPERWVGKCFRTSDIFAAAQGGSKNITAPGPDGIVRLMSFERSARAPWLVTVCFEEQAIREQAIGDLLKQLALLIPLVLVAVIGWLWIGRDVDGLYKAARRLSLEDPLTKLGSYQKFDQDLEKDIARAKRNMQSLSLLIIDIQGFKVFNQVNGVNYGNKALVQIATIIKERLRDTDFAYRFGGDEFALILTDTDEFDALDFAEALRRGIEESVFATKTRLPGKLTVSIGVATYPVDANDADCMVQCAEEALFDAEESEERTVAFSQTLRPKKMKKGG